MLSACVPAVLCFTSHMLREEEEGGVRRRLGTSALLIYSERAGEKLRSMTRAVMRTAREGFVRMHDDRFVHPREFDQWLLTFIMDYDKEL
ncbi:hypothetical protein SKAU_G00383380 [Synaphobranchus kaupii]|uniref:Uncharacterized protein n=1 Tax=Synaphobranchus kaupii TaxID=118154 RepID=A0A9Q1EE48_SYNKA|nr:hypothetical protein SKAU_G00383380 [Synaphobranchus kaupii]